MQLSCISKRRVLSFFVTYLYSLLFIKQTCKVLCVDYLCCVPGM